MRSYVLIGALLFALASTGGMLAKGPEATNIAFRAQNENGMLVVAENGGTAYAPGRYRFIEIDGDTRKVLSSVDIEVGYGRGPILVGRRPESIEATHAFHYAIVPPGDYALVYLDSAANSVVYSTDRWLCLSKDAPIHQVSAGSVAIVRVPARIKYDIYRDNGIARRAMLKRMPPGTTLDYLVSDEKVSYDFAEIVATNPLLTAPYGIKPQIGTLAFDATDRANAKQCMPAEVSAVTLNPPPQVPK